MAARIFYVVLFLSFLSFPVESADSTYKHSLGFSILIPDGWATDVQQSGVNVIKRPAFVSVFVVEGRGSPDGLRDAIVSSVASQWKNWQNLKLGSCKVSGLDGACGLYTGVDKRGDDLRIKVAALVKDGKGYILFVAGPRQNITEFSHDLNRIDSSFSLD